MDTAEHLELFIKGAIIGQLIGDALGYPYENVPNLKQFPEIEMVPGRHGESLGAYSCSSALMLSTIESINEYRGIDTDDIMDKFNDVYIAGYFTPDDECKDISAVTSESINNYANGIPVDRCGNRETSDNEALLRILPVGLYFATSSIDVLVDQSHRICSLTHGTPIDKVTCAVYSLIIRNMLLQKAEKVFDLLADYYKVKELKEYSSALSILLESKPKKSSGTKNVCDSFWSAWNSHVYNENDYQNCITDAVRLENDSNGTAALAGSFSGLANGLNDIPSKWLNTLRLSAHAMEVLQTFVNSIIKNH